MKTFRTIFILALVSTVFSSFSGFAQVEMARTENFRLVLTGQSGTYELTGVEIIKITPAGNLLRVLTFKIDAGNSILDLANPFAFFKVTVTSDFNGDGKPETLVDDFAVLTKTGNLKMVYHLNGKNK